MIQRLISKQHRVFNENGAGSQNKGGEQVDVDVVPGAVELSEMRETGREKTNMSIHIVYILFIYTNNHDNLHDPPLEATLTTRWQ